MKKIENSPNTYPIDEIAIEKSAIDAHDDLRKILQQISLQESGVVLLSGSQKSPDELGEKLYQDPEAMKNHAVEAARKLAAVTLQEISNLDIADIIQDNKAILHPPTLETGILLSEAAVRTHDKFTSELAYVALANPSVDREIAEDLTAQLDIAFAKTTEEAASLQQELNVLHAERDNKLDELTLLSGASDKATRLSIYDDKTLARLAATDDAKEIHQLPKRELYSNIEDAKRMISKAGEDKTLEKIGEQGLDDAASELAAFVLPHEAREKIFDDKTLTFVDGYSQPSAKDALLVAEAADQTGNTALKTAVEAIIDKIAESTPDVSRKCEQAIELAHTRHITPLKAAEEIDRQLLVA